MWHHGIKEHKRFWGAVCIMASHSGEVVIGFLKITRDLTDRMISENTIREQLTKLEFKNKELEQCVYIASHDLQEPLLNIMNFVELIENELPEQSSDDLRWYLEVVSKSSGRMRNLIKNLLDYSRIGNAEKLEKVNCMRIIDHLRVDLHTVITESGAVLSYENLPVITLFTLFWQSNNCKFSTQLLVKPQCWAIPML